MVKLDWKGDPTYLSSHVSFSSYKILVLFLAVIPALAVVVAIALIPVYVDKKLSTASVGTASLVEYKPIYKKLGIKSSVLVKKRSITYMNVSEILIIDHSKQHLNDSLKYAKTKSESQLLDCYVDISELTNLDIIWETFVTKVIMNGYFEFENGLDNLTNKISERLRKCVPLIRNSLSHLQDISIKEGNFRITKKVVAKNITEELYEINDESDEFYSDLILTLKNISQQDDTELNADLVFNLKKNLFDKLNFTDDMLEIYTDLMLNLNEYNYSKTASFVNRLKSLDILDEDVVSEVLLVLSRKNQKEEQFYTTTKASTKLETKTPYLDKSSLQDNYENNFLDLNLIIVNKNSTKNSSNHDDNLTADILVKLKQLNITNSEPYADILIKLKQLNLTNTNSETYADILIKLKSLNLTKSSSQSYADVSLTIKSQNQTNISNSAAIVTKSDEKLNENELIAEIEIDKFLNEETELNADLLIDTKNNQMSKSSTNRTKTLSLDQVKHLDNFFDLRTNLTSKKNESDELESEILISVKILKNSTNVTSDVEEALLADLTLIKKNQTQQNSESPVDQLDIDLLIKKKNVSTKPEKINKKLNLKSLQLDKVYDNLNEPFMKSVLKNQSDHSLILELLFTFKNATNNTQNVSNSNLDRTKIAKENQDDNNLLVDLLLMYKNMSNKYPTNESTKEPDDLNADILLKLKQLNLTNTGSEPYADILLNLKQLNQSDHSLILELLFSFKNTSNNTQNVSNLNLVKENQNDNNLLVDLLLMYKNMSNQSSKEQSDLIADILFKLKQPNQSEHSLVLELLFTFKNASNENISNLNLNRTKMLKEYQDDNNFFIDLLLMYKNLSNKAPTNDLIKEISENEINANMLIILKEKLQSTDDELNVDLLLNMVDSFLKNNNETMSNTTVTVLNNDDLKIDLVIKLKENDSLNSTNKNLTNDETDDLKLDLVINLKETNSSNASQNQSALMDVDDLRVELVLKLKENDQKNESNDELKVDIMFKLKEKDDLNDEHKFRLDEELNANVLLVLNRFLSKASLI